MGSLRTAATDFLDRWSAARCASRAAAIAFYTVFSLAPILVIVVAVGSMAVDEARLSQALLAEMERLIGAAGADLVQAMLASAREAPRGFYALVAAAILVVGATTAFAELKDGLDAILPSRKSVPESLWALVRARLLSFGLVLTLAFLLLTALVANTAMRAGTAVVAAAFGWENASFLSMASEIVSVLGAFLLFAAIYHILPDRRLSVRDWLAASALTTALFTVGRIGIGIYLGHSEASLAFGPAASLAIVMLWVYYAALIFLGGAVFAAVLDGDHAVQEGGSGALRTPAPNMRAGP